jgi:hypothetical protein
VERLPSNQRPSSTAEHSPFEGNSGRLFEQPVRQYIAPPFGSKSDIHVVTPSGVESSESGTVLASPFGRNLFADPLAADGLDQGRPAQNMRLPPNYSGSEWQRPQLAEPAGSGSPLGAHALGSVADSELLGPRENDGRTPSQGSGQGLPPDLPAATSAPAQDSSPAAAATPVAPNTAPASSPITLPTQSDDGQNGQRLDPRSTAPEVLTVPSETPLGVTSHTVLPEGKSFTLTATGDVQVGAAPSLRGDAQYQDFAHPRNMSADGTTPVGLVVVGATVQQTWPIWGAYNPEHVYQLKVVGRAHPCPPFQNACHFSSIKA